MLLPSILSRYEPVILDNVNTHIMIASAEINLLTEIHILELLKKSGINQSKIRDLQQTFHHIMSAHTIKSASRPTGDRNGSYIDILIYDLDVDNVQLLLTAALLEVFEKDILTALSIANLFGDEVCLAVDILTTQKSKHLSNKEFYDFVVERFNNGDIYTDNTLLTTVIILMMVTRISILKKMCRLEIKKQQAILSDTLQSFIPGFRNRLNLASISSNLTPCFQLADTLLKKLIDSNNRHPSLLSDLEPANNQTASITYSHI